jgi:parvulin-like peptidyl-prolyl isomerase
VLGLKAARFGSTLASSPELAPNHVASVGTAVRDAEPMSKVEFHLRFLRVKSEGLAFAAIAKLRSGRSFESVFDEYASAFDAHTFPHGDLGPHLETEFPVAEVRLYHRLKPGEFSQVPYEDTFGWEIDKLESKRTIPAPPLNAMRSRLTEYLVRAHSCGWAS